MSMQDLEVDFQFVCIYGLSSFLILFGFLATKVCHEFISYTVACTLLVVTALYVYIELHECWLGCLID